MTDGTLGFGPPQGRDETGGVPFSNITWSKDGGKSWETKPSSHEKHHGVRGRLSLRMEINAEYAG